MTIRKIVDENGETLCFRVRVERKETGTINRTFPDQDSAEEFLLDFTDKHPSKMSEVRNRSGIRIRTVLEHPERCKKFLPPETMSINGCLLIRGPGRCELMTECKHYLAPKVGCLDMAEKARWEGWSVKTS